MGWNGRRNITRNNVWRAGRRQSLWLLVLFSYLTSTGRFVSSVGQNSVPAHLLSWSSRLVNRRYGVYFSLALLLLIALVVRPEVYRPESLFLILRSASQLGMVALGQTLVMLVAGLDLSVSGVIVLTSVVIAQVGAGQDSRILPGLLVSLGFGASIGLANGL